jgi:Rab proteins geranylgeranyltransferase component A
MEDNSLKLPFDLIVLGTGLSESVVAAAAAKSGKRVLHLDAQGHYGGCNAALSLRQLEDLIFPDVIVESASLESRTPAELPDAISVASILHTPQEGLQFHGATALLPEALRKISSRFSIDLVPALIFSRGDTVDALLHSGASTYAEFKSVESVWVIDSVSASWTFCKVPSSKADVFASSSLGLLEKRRLMKFLGFSVDLAAHEDVVRMNERSLGTGRSLMR